jgi:hypothetical protein
MNEIFRDKLCAYLIAGRRNHVCLLDDTIARLLEAHEPLPPQFRHLLLELMLQCFLIFFSQILHSDVDSVLSLHSGAI